MKNLLIAILLSLVLASPALAGAQPGTNTYLRDQLNYSQERLTKGMITENRKPFALAIGETMILDPIADVVNKLGTAPEIIVPWSDITSASMGKNTDTQTWDVTVEVAEAIPEAPTGKVQFIFYADRDGNAENNSPSVGVRGAVDAAFTIEWRSKEETWGSDFRWYNKDADFWAMDKQTAMSFAVSGQKIAWHIPFAEISPDREPVWRTLVVVEQGGQTAIDLSPTVGFPPAADSDEETLAIAPAISNFGRLFNTAWIVAGIAILVGIVWHLRRRKN